MTPLHFASMRGHADVVVALLEGKADVAAIDKVK
jgi:ankyrin repeat protein